MNFTVIDLRSMKMFMVSYISEDILQGLQDGYLEVVDMFSQKSLSKEGAWIRLSA